MIPDPSNIRIEDYTYDLPPERIAKYPLSGRDKSKLLTWQGDKINDLIFSDLPEILCPGSLLVFNNTRVIRARLLFTKESGARIEIFCLEPVSPHDFTLNLSSEHCVEWKCMVGNLKRWKNGPLISEFIIAGRKHILTADRIESEGDTFRIRFEWDGTGISFGEVLEALGHMPIPPYLDREDEESDKTSYQTTYASIEGSVAAPTAGLHFTPALLDRIDSRGIERAEVTLHVSAGTFRPVKSENIAGHRMHTEHFFVSREIIEKLKDREVIAVGTTTVRTLESLYWLGASIANGHEPEEENLSISQWEPYENDSRENTGTMLGHILSWMEKRGRRNIEVKTDIIIIPGYRFRVIKGMITNYHQPGSTLLLLVAAFTGNSWKDIYNHALRNDYRFLSYGDSMLLLPSAKKR